MVAYETCRCGLSTVVLMVSVTLCLLGDTSAACCTKYLPMLEGSILYEL